MIVAVDARGAFGETPRGIAKCVVQLYRHVAALRPDWRFVMFHRGGAARNPFSGLDNVSPVAVRMPLERWSLWRQVWLPWAAKRVGAHVLHCPGNLAPRWPLIPMVLTVHDLIPWEVDPTSDAARRWLRSVSSSARAARYIICPSEYTRDRVVNILRVRPQRVATVAWAPDPGYRPNAAGAEDAATPARRYVLAFGASDPRKNTHGILRAWSLLSTEVRATTDLVVVGIQEPSLSQFQEAAHALGLADSVRLSGYVPEESLPRLMAGAEMLCYPSLSEGFGLPVLDAFASGTPVLTSDVTSLPEVAGDAALLVDPHRAESIAAGMARVLESDQTRQRLRSRGLERVEQFTWRKSARHTIEIIERARRRQPAPASHEASDWNDS